jgi:CIC family chloride channel protein
MLKHSRRNRTLFVGNGQLILATLATGALAGLGAVGFHYLADRFGEFLFTWGESHHALTRLPIVLTLPALGLGLVGLILQFIPESRKGGVTEVLTSMEIEHGIIPLRRMVNVFLSGLVLAFGGSVGPEGPMVQMGALAGSLLGQRLGMTKRHLQTIVRAGVAAGIAAAFRSPAGGVLLTLEIFGARFNQDLTAVGIAAAIGYLTRTAILGDAYPFRPPGVIDPLPLTALLVVVPLMGAVAAPAGHFFIWMFNRVGTMFPSKWPLSLRVGFGGLLVGVIGIWYPQVLSAGYPVIEQGLRGGIVFELFVVLLGLKMLATSITFGSGAVIGAMYGGAWGYGIHRILPQVVPQPEIFVLLGMVVMFGSIVKGYWSGLLMVADMSGCYHQLVLPGVIAGGVSYFLSWEIHDRSIFGLTLDQVQRRREIEHAEPAEVSV